jgi:hypothetical protein
VKRLAYATLQGGAADEMTQFDPSIACISGDWRTTIG